jgi:hypothetical protein
MAAVNVKGASTDAWQAFKQLVTNPVAGLSSAFEGLGEGRALGAGVVFGAVFALAMLFAAYRIMPMVRPQGFSGFIKALLFAIVPFVTLGAATMAARSVFGGSGGLAHDAFVAGATLLPVALVMILGALLGYGNFNITYMLLIFALILSVLMLNAGLTRIAKISERAASIAVPLVVILSGWLCKVIYAALIQSAMGGYSG